MSLSEIANVQDAQAKTVSGNLGQIRLSSDKVIANTTAITKSTEDAFAICNDLSAMSAKTTEGLRQCNEAAESLTNSANTISGETGQVKNQVANLSEAVNKFKV
mgnify:CR=1 FL=1